MNISTLRLACLTLSLICCAINTLSAKILHIADDKQYGEVLNTKRPLLVEFAAEWCSVCNGIQPQIEEISNDPEFKHITFAQVDVDKCDGVCKQNGIVGVPTFVYVENGAKKVEEIGVQKIPEFKDHLRVSLRKNLQCSDQDGGSDVCMAADQPSDTDDIVMVTDQPVATGEENFLMRIINSIVSFVTMIFGKIKDAIMTAVDAIRGFFTK